MLITEWNFHYLKKEENKMKQIALFFSILVFLFSCGNEKTDSVDENKSELKKEIIESISMLEKKGTENTNGITETDREELIKSLKNFYTNFPNDEKTPHCLDKLQMIYSSTGDYQKSIEYSEIIIKKFPNYVNRALIIENQAANYDIFISPRDSSKVRYYYELLLKENNKLDADKKSDIQKRLANNHLNFNQYVDFLASETKK